MKTQASNIPPSALLAEDAYLAPYGWEIGRRQSSFFAAMENMAANWGSLEAACLWHEEIGLHPTADGAIFREWAPGARALYLTGDFNGWDRQSHPLTRRPDGVWEIELPHRGGLPLLGHGSKMKVVVEGMNGRLDRIPSCARYVVQDPATKDFTAVAWNPPTPHVWRDASFRPPANAPIIYEAHVGMAQEKEDVGSYREFADLVLPRIARLGYNTVQLMAVAEHPYYGSFGYHVSNLYCPSSRFGTPEDLKYLVDQAHGLGLRVIMDLVHSHAVKNVAEGLNHFDGTEHQYFHPGGRGYHEGWDSMLFDYGKPEVRRFLLSNVRYWLEDFHFDGFRFDGVTSMLYFHHGNYTAFSHYDQYFVNGVDHDVLTHLQLANTLIHRIRPGALSICEDMSGMPGACRDPQDGGLGFDYRLGMGAPDNWIKLIKEKSDEAWDIHQIWHELSNRRWKEKTVAYAESHDQALVGDKTIAFRLMDQEMYWHMSATDPHPIIERGMALHKIIRLVTLVLGGEAWMNFMGNEFGHPEWIDFPREGNGWSHKYARRQWSLVDNPELKYKFLAAFDQAMVKVAHSVNLLGAIPAKSLNLDGANQVICAERANLVFVWNFSPTHSIPDYRFPCPAGRYRIVLSSDDPAFGGHGRVDTSLDYFTHHEADGHDRISVYATHRTALVLQKIDESAK